jgi:formate dehydrogenase maturation protein FdhE
VTSAVRVKCDRCGRREEARYTALRRVRVEDDGVVAERVCSACVDPAPSCREYLGIRGGLVPRQREKLEMTS